MSKTIKPGLKYGELAWEVMEQSPQYGEKPLRLVVSSESIRTVTSLILTKAASVIREYWKVESPQILKVSWCSDLCVLSVLYFEKDDPTTELTKVFFVDLFIGKKILKIYKKLKPASVRLSPSRPKSKTSKYSVLNNENRPTLSTAFIPKISLDDEKFWRAMAVSADLLIREIFIGVSPIGIRIVDPVSMEPELVIAILNMIKIEFSSYYGNNMLKLRYLEERSEKKKPKPKKLIYYVLPVTAKDLIGWYYHCNSEAETLSDLPTFKSADHEELITTHDVRPKRSQSLPTQEKHKLSRSTSSYSILKKENTKQPATNPPKPQKLKMTKSKSAQSLNGHSNGHSLNAHSLNAHKLNAQSVPNFSEASVNMKHNAKLDKFSVQLRANVDSDCKKQAIGVPYEIF